MACSLISQGFNQRSSNFHTFGSSKNAWLAKERVVPPHIVNRNTKAGNAVRRSLRMQAGANASTEKAWQTFCKAASGEWEGVTATFDPEGKPLELPSRYVPDEYLKWDQHIFDWQSISSTLAEGEELKRELRRMMPTVGCEADSVAFTEEKQVSEVPSDLSKGRLVFLEDGSYSVATNLTSTESMHKAEHCFATGADERIRVVHDLQIGADGLSVSSIEVHKERKDGPYNRGKCLSGCGGGMPSFAQSPATERDALSGSWVSPSESNKAHSDPIDRDAAVLLPLKTWSSIHKTDTSTTLLAGVALNQDTLYVSQQTYQGSNNVQVELQKLTRR